MDAGQIIPENQPPGFHNEGQQSLVGISFIFLNWLLCACEKGTNSSLWNIRQAGFTSEDGALVLGELSANTREGRNPFIAIGDWNETPKDLVSSGWLSLLQAECVHTGERTSTARNIDYAIVSKTIVHLVVGITLKWNHEFSVHASLRISLKRDDDELHRWVPARQPQPPALPSEISCGDELWAQIRQDKDDAYRWSSLLTLSSQAASAIEQWPQTLTQENASQPVEESTGRQHPLVPFLGDSLASKANELAGKLDEWVDDWYQWQFDIAGAPRKSGSSKGWVRARIGQDRTGPVAEIKVSPTLRQSARAAKTLTIIAEGLNTEGYTEQWVRAAGAFLMSNHASVEALSVSLGPEAMSALTRDLIDVVRVGKLEVGKPPANFLAKAKAALNKSTRLWKAESKEFFAKWLDMAFRNNGRLAHRWANAENVPPSWVDLPMGPGNSIHPLDHLAIQEDKFEKLWLADGPDVNSNAELFQQVREKALQRRKAGKEPLHELLKLVEPAPIRTVISSFKSNTSTGLCGLELKRLRKAPESALHSLSLIYKEMLTHLVGPANQEEAVLHLLLKKSGGYRTVATFPGLWRIFMGCIAAQFRRWDKEAADEGDSAVKGRSAEQRVRENLMEATHATAEGKDHTVILWDLAAFYHRRRQN